jgi:hypothetical protein
MKLATRAMIVDRYGMRVTMEQLAEILRLTPHTVYQQAVDGSLPIRTYKEGNRRFASYEAVADYLDAMDEQAKKNPG